MKELALYLLCSLTCLTIGYFFGYRTGLGAGEERLFSKLQGAIKNSMKEQKQARARFEKEYGRWGKHRE